ncbi:carboxymuconolactone decarboxylase family protein [Bradyrhizobium canariense]|uniref:carboxymuconolactone decarboxylase family protein n=1 Tax=Bradyrhizobium canariense TaxID=255045 RepID=UPI000A18D892|nr:hypothetical protein [Bradyrhizobium canariense]OSI22493.1 hypothetical protein BST65_24605 [Bradyrhizobium canariense]OSI28108.1 hypothetical protein BST66_30275 [Bradyrhizobium canariense]OSI46143.1 hypothetical protein BSZ20_11020 [Bradyrhizobium canariense]OSI48462.1 hypothetical protein BSZ15_38170 [Bradyrhizobium canariense]OSI53499.1 hypothetical protein BST67_08735 [Bradyrhizobium canariense]
MRLALLSTSELTPEQKMLYRDMRSGIETKFKGFEAINGQGILIGPWNPWLRFSKFGGPIWELVKVLSFSPTLPGLVREVAILVTGAHFCSACELYAHVSIAEAAGLSEDKIAAIAAGQCPGNLTDEEAVAYEVASALVSGAVLPEIIHRRAVRVFGEEGAAELIYLVGLYCLVSVTLNGFDVPVPDHKRWAPAI